MKVFDESLQQEGEGPSCLDGPPPSATLAMSAWRWMS